MAEWFQNAIEKLIATYHVVAAAVRDAIQAASAGYRVATATIYDFLLDIEFWNVILLVVQLLLSLYLLATLVNILLSVTSPKQYGKSHRQIQKRICKNVYWFALLLQLLLWCVAGTDTLTHMDRFNIVVCTAIGGLAVIGYLLSGIMMIFPGRGKRSYITADLAKLSNSLMLSGLWLLFFNWFLF